jgi:hypothetical protein
VGRVAIDDTTDRAADCLFAVNLSQTAVITNGEGSERAISNFKTFIKTIQGSVIGIDSEP